MSEGFGWNFYGFLVYATLWVAGYFVWARRANRKDRLRTTEEKH